MTRASGRALLRGVRRSMGHAAAATLLGAATVASRIPDVLALGIGDALAYLLYLGDARGRRAGHQNLRAVFGDGMPARERRRILRGSYRTISRGAWALLHLRPLSRERFLRHVVLTDELDARLRRIAAEHPSGVLVSGHLGNWELLLSLRTVLPYAPRIAYLVERTPIPELDEALDHLRGRGAGSGALRKGGSLALKGALSRGGSVGLLVDRNVRREHGGVYVPFLGLPARTTPLPVFLARRFRLPLSVMLCVPEARARWRLHFGPDLMEPPTGDEAADMRRILGKMNDELSDWIRRHPESWLWMIKRWKSRPTPERGRYPEYSYYDPDLPAG
jgi:KDO2-lipid IV(A) lauroyltransferase